MPLPAENPFAALGLPPSWAPVPVGWAFATVQAMTDTGVETVRVLIIDTPCGRQGLAFPGDTLRAFAEQCLEQASGLTVARSILEHPTNGQH